MGALGIGAALLPMQSRGSDGKKRIQSIKCFTRSYASTITVCPCIMRAVSVLKPRLAPLFRIARSMRRPPAITDTTQAHHQQYQGTRFRATDSPTGRNFSRLSFASSVRHGPSPLAAGSWLDCCLQTWLLQGRAAACRSFCNCWRVSAGHVARRSTAGLQNRRALLASE